MDTRDFAEGNRNKATGNAPTPEWFPGRQLPFAGLVALTALALYFSYQMVRPFLSAVLWSVAFAVLANPFHLWLCRKVGRRSLAAAISVAVVGVVVVVPTVMVAPKLAGEAALAVNSVAGSLESGQWQEKAAKVKAVSATISWVKSNLDLREVAREAARVATAGVSSFVSSSLAGVVQLLVSGFLLFYLFRDQEEALAALRSLLPFTAGETDTLFQRCSSTIHAIICGKLLTAMAQGTLGGIGFWLLGLPAPWFWGLVMCVLSFLPIVGASFVWGPAVVFLAFDGRVGAAVFLALLGMVAITSIESFLYPIMAGHRLKLHDALVFVALLGGVLAFGPVGLIVGPAVLALTLGLLTLWKQRVMATRAADTRSGRVGCESR